MEKIIILAPYPPKSAPSQRFRFEQYIDEWSQSYEVELHPFLDEEAWKKLYVPKQNGFKVKKMLQGFWRRFLLLGKIRKAKYVFIHREASHVGPPIFEWIIAKILRKKFIYDFDDAIWIPNFSDTNATFQRLKAYGKIRRIIQWADQVVVGNDFLAGYAKKFNANVQVIPTTVDTDLVHNLVTNHSPDILRIGWTGTHTTMNYLPFLVPILEKLKEKHTFKFRVISNEAPQFSLDYLEYIPWNKSTEIFDLSQIQIGVMPLENDRWSAGKCGFKALQYMALEIPTVLSPVGVNTTIVQNDVNGILVSTSEEWYERLDELLSDLNKRQTIGKEGRKTVLEKYSVAANRAAYKELFN